MTITERQLRFSPEHRAGKIWGSLVRSQGRSAAPSRIEVLNTIHDLIDYSYMHPILGERYVDLITHPLRLESNIRAGLGAGHIIDISRHIEKQVLTNMAETYPIVVNDPHLVRYAKFYTEDSRRITHFPLHIWKGLSLVFREIDAFNKTITPGYSRPVVTADSATSAIGRIIDKYGCVAPDVFNWVNLKGGYQNSGGFNTNDWFFEVDPQVEAILKSYTRRGIIYEKN